MADQQQPLQPEEIGANPIVLTQKTLQNIGVSAKIIGGLAVLMLAVIVYKNYFEMKKTKLEITKLKGELKLT